MPDALTVDEFIGDTLNDVRHPLKSDFISKISSVRCTVYSLDEGLETDRNVLVRSRKLVKSVVASGIAYAEQITLLCDFLERLGQIALEGNEPNGNDIATSLCKFSVVHRDLANMTKHLMQNLNSIVVFPMETFMQGDIKSDLKKPFEKALKDYEYKYDKLRKEKLQTMKETGCYVPEAFTEGMTKDLEKERRRLQLETCEYLIKVNELKAKRGADLLQHLIDFFYVQTHYLRECLGVMDHFGKSMNDLSNRVNELHKINDIQKRRLVDTREEVKGVLDKECDSIRRKSRLFGQSVQTGVTYAAQPTPLNRAFGTKKSGFLLKKSDGKVKRVWQRRRVHIADGELCLYHADESKPPVRLTLLTCQVKLPTECMDNDSTLNHSTGGGSAGGNQHSTTSEGKLYFDLVSNSRTYNFQAEDEQEYEEWISILNNAMQEEFNKAMNGENYINSQCDLSETALNLSSNRSMSTNKCNITNGDSLAADIDLVYSTLTGQGNSPMNNNSSKHIKSDSFGDSLPGSENDLLDSSGSQISCSRESHLDSADAFSTDGINATESKGRPSKSLIQSSLRFCAPGNEVCADCGRPDPEWVSVNLGILICLECCGAHRELGVHYSRTQSLLMDELSTNQLLLPRFIGNQLFNSVYESSLPAGSKPNALDSVTDPTDGMTQRRNFIKSKYVDRRFITKTTSDSLIVTSNSLDYNTISNNNKSFSDDISTSRDPIAERFLRRDLLRAVKTGNLSLLIQVFAERLDLMTPFKPEDNDDDSYSFLPGTTALHIAVETTNKFLIKSKSNYPHGNKVDMSDLSEQQQQITESFLNFDNNNNYEFEKSPHNNLPLVEFILQNSSSGSLKRANQLGDTALHHAARYGCVDALKLIVQAGGIPTPILQLTNHNGQTALDIVENTLIQYKLNTTNTNNNNNPILLDTYKTCQHILKLSDFIASNISSCKTNCLITDSISSLFSNINGSIDKLSTYRNHLIELLNQLNSINWCQLNTSSTSSSSSTSTTTTSTTTTTVQSINNEKITMTTNSLVTASTPNITNVPITNKLEISHNNNNYQLGTFSLSPIMKCVNQLISTRNPCESYTPKQNSTEKQITFDENIFTRGNNATPPVSNKPTRSYSQHSPSIHYGSALATLPRKKGPAPRPPSVDDQMNVRGGMPSNSTGFWSTFNRLDNSRTSCSSIDHEKSLPKDHIDIILDVLEEKPIISESLNTTNPITVTNKTGTMSSTMKNSCIPITTSSINTSPAIPPKPSYLSNTIYSTLPNRSSHLNRNSSVQPCSNLPVLYDSSFTESSPDASVSTKEFQISTVNSPSHLVDSIKFSLPQHTNDKYDTSHYSPSSLKCHKSSNNLSILNCKVGDLLEALYDCEAENSDELTFNRGEIIQLIDRPDNDWWEGFIQSDPSRRGMFPVTYVKRLSDN
uniref:Putative development and differentiation-enhancing factor, ddef n=1 Tax=Schistosoma mansoni TaxID=6183 RepID=A0A3Q0KUG3_SCHMA